jgi:MFS superfamily sulfate permease-like transporter
MELYLLFVIMCFNFIAGFCFGMLLSMLGFTARYVKTPIIKAAVDAREYQGKALRDTKSKTILRRYGTEIITLRLQVAMGGKVIFIPPYLFCMVNHQ